MDSDDVKPQRAGPRRVKFVPKGPPRRVPKAEVKVEAVNDDADAVQAKELLRRFNENAMKARPKVEKKVTASQIAFGAGGSSSAIRSYGTPWGAASHNGSSAFGGGSRAKEYREPWDYYSNYPCTLPVRRPYSGNPELLDEEEFGETAEYNENSSNQAAMELGLLEENPEPNLFLLNLPATFPMIKQPEAAASVSVAASASTSRRPVKKPCNLGELPSGLLGKLVVYKSGAVKLKLGDTVYDVSSGIECSFAQDAIAINTAKKEFCTVGEITKHVTITPDIDSIPDL